MFILYKIFLWFSAARETFENSWKQKFYNCSKCTMAFCTKHNLKIHSHDHQICNKSCWQPYRLKEHTMTHTGEKSFNCTVCTKSFSQAGNLKTHFRVLSKEKPFSCSLCTKSFSQLWLLKHPHRRETLQKLAFY